MVVNSAWQLGFGGAHFAIAALVIFVAARAPVRRRDWPELRFRMLVLIGGALGAVFFEGAVDRAGELWYAVPGQWRMIDLFGTHVPLWVMPVYLWFAGGFALLIILQIRNGAPPSTYLKIGGALVLADLMLEVPIIRIAKLYVYYGHNQPLFQHSWFPLPAWYITTNVFFVMLPALLVLTVMSTERRHIEWTIPFVMLAACYMSYGSVAWPVIAALQNDVAKTGATFAALLSMTLGAIAIYISVQVAPRLKHAMDWYSDPDPARRHVARHADRTSRAAAGSPVNTSLS
jgi:hypothetical protein